MDVAFYQETRFNRALAGLQRAGGVSQQAVRRVYEILGRARSAESLTDLGPLTHYGEGRIRHCVKFDLPGAHRLVCLYHDGVLSLLFVGSHEDCDRWLDENRGLTILIDRESRKVHVVSHVPVRGPLPPKRINFETSLEKSLLDALQPEDLDILPISASSMRRLMVLTPTSADEDILDALGAISSCEDQELVLNVLLALKEGNNDGAAALIAERQHRAIDAAEDPASLKDAIHAEANAGSLVSLRDLSDVEIEHLFNRASFREWITFLHPDQARLSQMSFEGPAVLSGVSGSGKTCVLVHRAKHLASRFPTERILILTLNEALAALIAGLVDELGPPEVSKRIEVRSMSSLCASIVRRFAPDRHLMTEDPRSKEDLEDCWDDSFAWPDQQTVLEPVLRSLRATHNIDAVRYLRDEFIWIRSGLRRDGVQVSALRPRAEYADPELTPRHGRAIAFSGDWRSRVLRALDHYEEWMVAGGFVDPAALSLEAHSFIERLRNTPHPFHYRAVLVDEMQDFGSVELEIVRAIAPEAHDSLMLCGDSNQQVFPKSHGLTQAGIRVAPSERRYLRKNYRNTKQTLEAGLALLESYGATELLTESELRGIQPELSVREGPRPVAVGSLNRTGERTYIIRYVTEQLRLKPDAPVCIAVCGVREDNPRQLAALQRNFVEGDLPIRLLTQDSTVLEGGAYLATLETVKGFEFGTIVVMRCDARTIPDSDAPQEERWRDARRLYVAMTRGRDEVLFTYTGEPSEYLLGMKQLIQFGTE